MSADGVLGAKKLRVIERITGITPDRALAYHPYWKFRDARDIHFVLVPRTGEWWRDRAPLHWTSCGERR